MAINVVLVPILTLVWREMHRMRKRLEDTNEMIRLQNSRVVKLEQWTRDHEILDKERGDNVLVRLAHVQDTVEALRNHR